MEIKRDYYLNKLIDTKNDGLIKIITGIRRCGKSYLLNKLFYEYLIENNVDESHIVKIALDNDENEKLLNNKELGNYIRNKIKNNKLYYILLDEIQLVENFERVLNG